MIRQTPADLRRRHRAIAICDVQANPGISRSEIARRLGLSDMAATRIVRELLEANLLHETVSNKQSEKKVVKPGRSVGRPKIGLNINERGFFGAGMTFSAYYSEVSLSDGNGNIIGRRKVKNPPFSNPKKCAKLFSKELERLILELAIPKMRICGVGIVLSAKVEWETSTIVQSDYFGWKEDDGVFGKCVEEILGLPISIRNISDAIAIAEMQYGVAQNINNFALIHTATLSGASVIANGELLLGHNGIAGRIGHFAHKRKDFACVCGRNDCLNLSASGFGILKKLGLHDDAQFCPEHIADYAKIIKKLVQEKNETELRAAGQSIASLIDMLSLLLNPEIIVLSGFIGNRDEYVAGAIEAYQTYRAKTDVRSPKILTGNITAVKAAPMLALSDLCFSEKCNLDNFLTTAHLVDEVYNEGYKGI